MSHHSPPVIQLQQLSHAYGDGPARREVLRQVSAEIGPGEWVALLGASGSGKSTLLHLIAGLERPSAGSVWVLGVDMARADDRARTLHRRRHIGLVFQFFHLVPTLTVLDNVLLPTALNAWPRRVADVAARELLAEVGLGERAADAPDCLSGGEQQRIAIARALAHDPAVVLADEPTGNLDGVTGRQILELLERTLRRRGKTLLIATHSAEVAARADRVLHLIDGYLVAQ